MPCSMWFYVDVDRGIYKGKTKSGSKWKMQKILGFSFYINIANFEAFPKGKKLSSNLFFLKSEMSLGLNKAWPSIIVLNIFGLENSGYYYYSGNIQKTCHRNCTYYQTYFFNSKIFLSLKNFYSLYIYILKFFFWN